MLYKYINYKPVIGKSVFIAPSADIIGNVTIGDNCSIWFNVTIRGDVHFIKIGDETNIQDNSILHVTNGKFPLNIGNWVTVAHGFTHVHTKYDRSTRQFYDTQFIHTTYRFPPWY